NERIPSISYLKFTTLPSNCDSNLSTIFSAVNAITQSCKILIIFDILQNYVLLRFRFSRFLEVLIFRQEFVLVLVGIPERKRQPELLYRFLVKLNMYR